MVAGPVTEKASNKLGELKERLAGAGLPVRMD